ncbi:MAG: hypothetical protein ACFFCZ_07170 [Promethearchaeota archaeon]
MQMVLDIALGGLELILLAFICEYIDSAIGGGYGTILVPVLLIFEFDSNLIIPGILFTEIWSGIGSAVLHNFVGNAKFEAKIDLANGKNLILSDDFKVSTILSVCGVFGGIIVVMVSLSFPKMLVKTYIGILVVIIGIMILLNLKWNFSWLRIWGIGLLAAFNKGISGGVWSIGVRWSNHC